METVDWSIVASGWERNRDTVQRATEALAQRLLDELALQPGERVLELGGGTGDFARTLADAVGPTGHVIATDVAAGMVAVMKRTLDGVGNADVRQVDATAIDLPDASVDAVVFRMGLMFTLDPAAVLAGIRRVLAPGGRVAIATWAAPQHNPWAATVGMAAMVQGLVQGGPPTGPGGLFSIGTSEALDALLEGAGFATTCAEIPLTLSFASAEAHVAHVLEMAAPLAHALQGATPEQLDQLRAAVTGLTAPFATDDGLALPGLALLGIGRT